MPWNTSGMDIQCGCGRPAKHNWNAASFCAPCFEHWTRPITPSTSPPSKCVCCYARGPGRDPHYRCKNCKKLGAVALTMV